MANQANMNYRNGNTHGNGGMPLEKDFSGLAPLHAYLLHEHSVLTQPFEGHQLGDHEDPENALRRIQTAGSISISPELFEKIYLSPQNAVKGELRKTFANPTPL